MEMKNNKRKPKISNKEVELDTETLA